MQTWLLGLLGPSHEAYAGCLWTQAAIAAIALQVCISQVTLGQRAGGLGGWSPWQTVQRPEVID